MCTAANVWLQESNESDRCFFNIANDGGVFYHCFDGDAHARCAGVYFGNVFPRIAWENDMFIGVPEIHTDLWKQGTEVKIHDNDYNYNSSDFRHLCRPREQH